MSTTGTYGSHVAQPSCGGLTSTVLYTYCSNRYMDAHAHTHTHICIIYIHRHILHRQLYRHTLRQLVAESSAKPHRHEFICAHIHACMQMEGRTDGQTDRRTDRSYMYTWCTRCPWCYAQKRSRFKMHAIMYTSPEFLGLGQKLQDLIF